MANALHAFAGANWNKIKNRLRIGTRNFPSASANLCPNIYFCSPQERTLLHNGVEGAEPPRGVVGQSPTVFFLGLASPLHLYPDLVLAEELQNILLPKLLAAFVERESLLRDRGSAKKLVVLEKNIQKRRRRVR